jgi:hypothetical protein
MKLIEYFYHLSLARPGNNVLTSGTEDHIPTSSEETHYGGSIIELVLRVVESPEQIFESGFVRQIVAEKKSLIP